MLENILINKYFWAIGIPIIFLLCGSFIKKLIGRNKFKWEDFYLGIESSLSSFTAALIYIAELVKRVPLQKSLAPASDKIIEVCGFLTINFFMLLVVMAMHQSYAQQDEQNKINKPNEIALKKYNLKKKIVLGIVSNLLGSGLLIAFILQIRR